LPEVPLAEPSRRERLKSENEFLGYPASGHPFEIAWETYCPVWRLSDEEARKLVDSITREEETKAYAKLRF
jgi:hypothetical protein